MLLTHLRSAAVDTFSRPVAATSSRYRRLLGGLLDVLGPRPPRPAAGPVEHRLLFVCYGNSCRSPLAHGVFRAKLAAEGLLGRVAVDSAGTSAGDPGAPPDYRARRIARRHGVAIGDLRARQLEADDFDRFDRIVVFDQRNFEDATRIARNEGERAKVTLLIEGGEIADPVRGPVEAFERAFAQIDEASERLLEDVRARLDS